MFLGVCNAGMQEIESWGATDPCSKLSFLLIPKLQAKMIKENKILLTSLKSLHTCSMTFLS